MSNVLYRFYSAIHEETFGPAAISGKVKKLTADYAEQPVYLFKQDGFRLVRETVSASDGSFTFANLSADTEWIVASIDKSGAYNIVAADRVKTP